MSMYNYFKKLGTVSYNGDIVNNIITSIRFKDVVEKNNFIFYPYTIEEYERPDLIAEHYYGDSRYTWVVYLSNKIVDPYFEWPLSTNEFRSFIIKKYGSVEAALEKIEFYRNNWYGDDSIISTSAYGALISTLKKYWSPIIGYSNAITSYERKQVDFVLETNQVVELILSNVTGLSVNEKITQRTSGAVSATGFIGAIKTNSIVLKNITGAFAVTDGSVGSITNNSGSASKSVSTVTIISTPIPATELSYWEAVTAYDYENEFNESRKNIQLLDRQYIDQVEDQILELMS